MEEDRLSKYALDGLLRQMLDDFPNQPGFEIPDYERVYIYQEGFRWIYALRKQRGMSLDSDLIGTDNTRLGYRRHWWRDMNCWQRWR